MSEIVDITSFKDRHAREKKRSVNMLILFTEKRQCTLQLITSVLFKPVWLLFLYSDHMLRHSGCDPFFLNVPQRTLSYLIHSQIYFRGVCMTLKKINNNKTKCVSGGYLKNPTGTYLTVHNMHACRPDPNWFLALVGFGFWGFGS